MENKLPEDFKRKWVDALRSGEYKQGNGNLYLDDTYCCMGVAGIVCGVPKDSMLGKTYFDSSAPTSRVAPPEGWPSLLDANVRLVHENIVYRMARMNDIEDKSFAEIADYIEQNL